MTSELTIRESPAPSSRGRRLVRPLGTLLWVAVLGLASVNAARDPSTANLAFLGVFAVLCLAVNIQHWLHSRSGHQTWSSAAARLGNGSYIDEHVGLPNRTYLLAEIRRQIARSTGTRLPFTLLQLSLNDFTGVRERRGPEFADRSVRTLANLLRRVTRDGDFLAHLEDASFAVLLVDANLADAREFVRAVPGWVSVSDGRDMFDIAVVARFLQYDLEGVYSSDILRQLETSQPFMREQRQMADHA